MDVMTKYEDTDNVAKNRSSGMIEALQWSLASGMGGDTNFVCSSCCYIFTVQRHPNLFRSGMSLLTLPQLCLPKSRHHL